MSGKNTGQGNKFLDISHNDILLLSKKVVGRYVNKGSVPKREEEDITMSVVEKFLLKKDQITSNFQGQSQFTTYCIAILNRMCCEMIRKEKKHWIIADEQVEPSNIINYTGQAEQLLIKEQMNLLHKIIMFFGIERHKIRLFMAYFYRLSISETDIEKYDKQYLLHELKTIFMSNEDLPKGEIFKNLSEVVKLVEDKKIKPDAVRMWLNKIRSTVINRLNTYSGKSNYTNDSFQALYEYYYVEGGYQF